MIDFTMCPAFYLMASHKIWITFLPSLDDSEWKRIRSKWTKKIYELCKYYFIFYLFLLVCDFLFVWILFVLFFEIRKMHQITQNKIAESKKLRLKRIFGITASVVKISCVLQNQNNVINSNPSEFLCSNKLTFGLAG